MLLVPLAAALTVSACSDDADDSADDPRRGEIGGVAELAVNAYASAGPEAMYDYISTEVALNCSKSDVVAGLQDQVRPTGFRQLKDVDFDGDTAEATIIISTRDGERDVVWTYVNEDGKWRINEMPGLEDCEL